MSSVADAIVAGARGESQVWAAALAGAPDWAPVFSPLAPAQFALGLETVYEAYLVHYGSPRLFHTPDADEAILLGDYLYAHGLVRIAEAGGVAAVSVLADLIARCAALRADAVDGDGDAWIDAARQLGGSAAEAEIAAALERHNKYFRLR
jgi:hypothetical protein